MTTRDRNILLVLGALAALAAFWFLAIKPKRAEVQTLSSKVSTQQQRLATAQATVNAGLAAKASYPKDYAAVAQLGKALPADDDLPSLLYQLDAESHGSHIDFESIARGASASTTAATPPSTTDTTGTSATGASALPPGATVGTAGLATLPFSFTFSGSFFDLQKFIQRVQDFVRPEGQGIAVRGRLLTIEGVSLVPGTKGLGRLDAKIAATAYLAPSTTPAATTGTTPSATTPDSGATASTAAPTTSAIAGGSN
jgi:Tfp pilus assembly protein PilO